VQGTALDTPCLFASEAKDHDEMEFSDIATGPGIGIDEEISMELMETTVTHEVLKLWPWVNQVSCAACCSH
jgi:chloride channel 3/4/5